MKRFVMVLGLTVMACAGAQAQVTVSVGSGAAQDCYRHARFGFDPNAGVKVCAIALTEVLTIGDRAATFDNRGIILNQLGRLDGAASDFAQAISLQPALGDPYINIGSVLIKKKSYDAALVQIDKGIALGMSFPQIGYYDRAVALQLLGRFKESYFDYKKALEIEPGFTLASERLKDFTVTTIPANHPG